MSLKLRHMEMATLAMKIVEDLTKEGGKKSERVEVLRKIPSHIQTSGLGQTVAWLLKKDTTIANELCGGLQKLSPGKAEPKSGPQGRQDPGKGRGKGRGEVYLKALVTGDATNYRHQSRQALAFAEWLKRFVDVEKSK